MGNIHLYGVPQSGSYTSHQKLEKKDKTDNEGQRKQKQKQKSKQKP